MSAYVIRRKMRSAIDRVLNKLLPDYLGSEFMCPICGTGLSRFTPLPTFFLRELDKNGFVYSIFQSETLNLENYGCPRCGSSDRERLYAVYFKETIDLARKYRLLDFAPAPALHDWFRTFSNIECRSADLFMEGVDDRVDITDMHVYPDGAFDIFICSHVLEHIPDDRKAMTELCRVLNDDGWGITMVPINLDVEKTHEDESIIDEGLRWKYFGQNDHVRMYAKQDFIDRLEKAGLTVDQLGVEHFGADTFRLYGIHPRSVLYVVHK